MKAFRFFSQVLVKNIETNVNRDLALKVFSSVGEVKDLTIEFDPNTESNSGFILIDYENLQICEQAVTKFNNKKVLGSFIKLEVLQDDPSEAELKWKPFTRRTEYKTKEKPEMFYPSI